MLIDGQYHRTIWTDGTGEAVRIFDQTRLPHEVRIVELNMLEEAATAIEVMQVRGAPLIGATAAYGFALAMRADTSDKSLDAAASRLSSTRPTAVNLRWAIERMRRVLGNRPPSERLEAAYGEAARICDEDIAICQAIGEHGVEVIERAALEKPNGEPVNILTHCNAGWLATIDWGTATAPIYRAQQKGIPIHVWVDETRPRNQGAALTAFEFIQQNVPHSVIVDNAGGHLMQHGMVDLCMVGTDRTTRSGDVCNKIGTYLKALAASENNVPFYVALPSTTIDWTVSDGIRDIPIEQRDPREVTHMTGQTEDGRIETVNITPRLSPAANFAFDVTPARYVTALITERGISEASAQGLQALFRDRSAAE